MQKQSDFDTLRQGFNMFFNPGAYADLPVPAGTGPAAKTLEHAGGVLLGFGGLGYGARKLLESKRTADSNKLLSNLREQANARFPVWAPNPDETPEAEELERRQGTELPEEVDEDRKEIQAQRIRRLRAAMDRAKGISSAPPQPVSKEANSSSGDITSQGIRPPDLISSSQNDPQPDTSKAVTYAAALAGLMGGWSLANRGEAAKRRAAYEDEIKKQRAAADRLVYAEYLRTRGVPEQVLPSATDALQKAAGFDTDADVANQGGGILQHPGDAAAHWWTGIKQAYWLYALSALALSYSGMRAYADGRDPNRSRLKQLQEVAQERARSEDPPVLIDQAVLPSIPGISASSPARRSKPLGTVALPPPAARTPAPGGGAGTNPVDSSDALGDMLK